MKNNIKDAMSNICGAALLVSGIVLSLATTIAVPPVAITIATVAASVSGSVIAYLTGKKPNGTKKTASQVTAANIAK